MHYYNLIHFWKLVVKVHFVNKFSLEFFGTPVPAYDVYIIYRLVYFVEIWKWFDLWLDFNWIFLFDFHTYYFVITKITVRKPWCHLPTFL